MINFRYSCWHRVCLLYFLRKRQVITSYTVSIYEKEKYWACMHF